MKNNLNFTKDNFRILCISDIHGGVGYDEKGTNEKLNALLDKTDPDLCLILGDIAGPGVIHIETAKQLKEMLDSFTLPFAERNIPFANVFGNHDDNYGLDNREAQKVYETFPLCVSKGGPSELDGSGNYVISIYDKNEKEIIFNIFAFDSHRGDDKFKERYNIDMDTPIRLPQMGEIDSGERGVDFEQVNWYYNESIEFEKACGRKIPALAVMHVPLQEMAWASLNKEICEFDGVMEEPVSCQALNAGLMRAALERGDIKAFCFGHDHDNNFSVKYSGVILSYDGYLSCHACHRKETLGGRVFDININEPSNLKTEFVNAL